MIPVIAIIFSTVSFSEYLPKTKTIPYDIDSDGRVSENDVSYILALSSSSTVDISPSIRQKADVDNDGNKADFSLTLHENELHYKVGKKIKILMPEY